MLEHEANLKRNLKRLMEVNDLNQSDLSKETGIVQQTISRALHAGRIRRDKVEVLAKYFKVTPELLFSDDLLSDSGDDIKNMGSLTQKKEGQTIDLILSNPSGVLNFSIERLSDGNYKVTITT